MKSSQRRIRKPRIFDPLLRYEIPEASELLRQSVAKTWVDVRKNRLQVIRDGGRTYVPGSEIVRVSSLPSSRRGATA